MFRTETEYKALIIKDSLVLVRSQTKMTDSLIKVLEQRDSWLDSAIYYKNLFIKEQKDHESTLVDYDNFVKSETKFMRKLNQQLSR